MTRKSTIRKILDIVLDVFEIYVPVMALAAVIFIFGLQVFMRYVFRAPLTWAFELTLCLYVYIVMFGACYALRESDHVCFSMYYDSRGKKAQAVMRLLESIIFIVIFAAVISSVIDYAWFIRVASLKTTSALKIQYKYLYLSFVFMLFAVAIRLTLRAIGDLGYLISRKREEDA